MSNVLLIEPDTVLSRTYVQAMELGGHNVRHVYTAEDAIQAADTQTPDIVVLELCLAVHSGIEFLHEFRSYSEWQTTPVIINTYMTPTSLEALRSTLATDLGITTCLYKPRTTLKMLLSIIRRQLQVA